MEVLPLAGISRPVATTREPEARQDVAEPEVRSSSGQFFVSPVLRFDQPSLTVIFQIRDRESGDVTRQFPAETVVERYRQDPSARPFVLPERQPNAGETTETAETAETIPAPSGDDGSAAPNTVGEEQGQQRGVDVVA